MKLAVMQPYFLPYIGYFQLARAVDQFVVYDNIKYTKKGWINRNRFCRNGEEALFSLPLKNAPDHLDVRDRELAPIFDRAKLLGKFREAYRRAPSFNQTYPIIESAVLCREDNLFAYIFNSIKTICDHLEIATVLKPSSEVPIDHSLTAQDKVIAFGQTLGASTYINAIGGQELYDRASFSAAGIDLRFIRTRPMTYGQSGANFIPSLSIIDVLMFNEIGVVRRQLLQEYDLV